MYVEKQLCRYVGLMASPSFLLHLLPKADDIITKIIKSILVTASWRLVKIFVGYCYLFTNHFIATFLLSDDNIKLLSQDVPLSELDSTPIRRSRSESHSDQYEELYAEDPYKVGNGKHIHSYI